MSGAENADKDAFISAVYSDDVSVINKMLKEGYDPSGVHLDTESSVSPFTTRSSLHIAAVSKRIGIAGLIIDRLKEIHKNNPEQLIHELMNGFVLKDVKTLLFKNEDYDTSTSISNGRIVKEIHEVLPLLPKHVRAINQKKLEYLATKCTSLGLDADMRGL